MSSNPETPEAVAAVSEPGMAGQNPSGPNPADEGLPLDFPLTPEDVQDEAVRGDFVIRWAVVLLALLMGFALIDQTMALVHVKSGEYLSAHGFLPPQGGDPFSATAEKRTWVNLSWLFDLLVGWAYGVGSWSGVSVLKGVLGAAAFWQLVRISRPKLPTWWGSICAIPALVVCQPRMTAMPEVVTLLGVALTLRLLHEWKSNGNLRSLQLLIPVFLLWSNLDGRVFVGVWLLLLTAIGEGLTRIPLENRRPLKPLLVWVGCAVGATFLHPFPGGWISQTLLWYQEVYPAFRSYTLGGGAGIQYYQVASREFFRNPHPSGILGIALLLTAGVTLFLNRKRLEVTDLLQFFGFAVLAVLSVHELGAASLVFCVLATLNGQSWYADRFNLEYTTDSRFLLFSRGGRAVTVLGLFAIALFVTVGTIRGPGGSRLGFGLSGELTSHVSSYESLLGKTHGDRGFDFNPAQGDLMIWTGKKPFIDQRLELYVGSGTENLIDLHIKTRDTFRVTEQMTLGSRRSGLETLEKYGISFAIPRLTGFNPDYQTMAGLLSDPNWRMQRLGASTAVFYRFDAEDKELLSFLEETQQLFTEEAFRRDAEPIAPHVGWPTPPSFYERYLWGRSEELSGESLEGQHLMRLATSLSTANPAMAYLAIRRAQQALSRNANDVLANIVLGEAYAYLREFEVRTLPAGQRSGIEQMRYLECVAAYHHALIADPEQAYVHYALSRIYLRAGKLDLALRELQAYQSSSGGAGQKKGGADSQETSVAEELKGLEAGIQNRIEECEKILEGVSKEEQGGAKLGLYYSRGLILKTLEELSKLPGESISNPEVIKLRALCYQESGRTEEAYDLSGQLEGMSQQMPNLDWRGLRTTSLLSNGEYDRAVQLWEETILEGVRGGFANLVVNLSPQFSSEREINWPLTELQSAGNYFFSHTDRISSLKLNAALTHLERGTPRKAGETLEEILEENPEAAERRTVAYYLAMIQQKAIDPLPPSERIPVLFAAEPEAGQ